MYADVFEGFDDRPGRTGFLAIKELSGVGQSIHVSRILLSMVDSELAVHYKLAALGLSRYICSPLGHGESFPFAAAGAGPGTQNSAGCVVWQTFASSAGGSGS